MQLHNGCRGLSRLRLLNSLSLHSQPSKFCSLLLDLANLPASLRDLDLSELHLMHPQGLAVSQGTSGACCAPPHFCPSLQRLRLHQCSGEAPLRLMLPPSLRSLTLSDAHEGAAYPLPGTPMSMHWVERPSMAEVARACPRLEVLLADSCYGFHYGVPAVRDDAELGRLAALSGSLRELNLRLGGAVTASGLACLAGLCNLTALGIFLGEPGGKGSRQGEPPYLPWFEVPFFVDRNQQPTMQC